jgi:GT2 family glycosyltransferase
MPRAGIDVIVPVCGAPEALARCLASLEQHADAGLDRILLVVDGPQTQAVELVIAAAAARRSPPALTALYQPERAGYPAAVQRGIEEGEASGRDVVLLNSDTVVAAGWLDRLAAAAASAPRVGTVTPFTNNGTLASLPRPFEINRLADRRRYRELRRPRRAVLAASLSAGPDGGRLLLLRQAVAAARHRIVRS